MFKFPYVSIDVETTGLDVDKSHVLQLAAVYDDGSHVESLSTFNMVIRWPVIHHGEEFALNLNKVLLERAFKKDRVVSIEQARKSFGFWLDSVQFSGRFTPAGKNIQGFDVPILENPVNEFSLRRFNRRSLDPGSMFAEDFDHVPTLSEINKVTGRKPVTHDALDDCMDVVYAIRHKWNC
jgi:oligoribonuclease (3'-5' exoribonuclease)